MLGILHLVSTGFIVGERDVAQPLELGAVHGAPFLAGEVPHVQLHHARNQVLMGEDLKLTNSSWWVDLHHQLLRV